MASTIEYKISCHCGGAAQAVIAAPQKPGTNKVGISLCHCSNCRHNTGVLCTSYLLIQQPRSLHGLKAYSSNSAFSRYFCATCGCHVFWHYGSGPPTEEPNPRWAVATGVVVERTSPDNGKDTDEVQAFQFARHINVASTKDGGLSPFMEEISGVKMDIHQHQDDVGETQCPSLPDSVRKTSTSALFPSEEKEKTVQGFCHCGTVRFHITHPDATSRAPRSGFADLIMPFKTGPEAQFRNPDDVKWWLRPADAAEPTHYLAGTCACRSCRVISGFEIQTWAFVPRSNIFFHIHDPPSVDDTQTETGGAGVDSPGSVSVVPLDFAAPPAGILRTYKSSPGVLRESCVNCGATVFWHDKWRPELIDVSVGLLDAPEGTRAESLLDWWKGRTSFAEDADNGRQGVVAERAVGLIVGLEQGLRRGVQM